MANPDLTNSFEQIKEWLESMPVVELLGAHVQHAAGGEAELVLPYADQVSFSSDGRFSGAAVAALIDFCAGAAAASVLSPGRFARTVDLTTKLLAPVTEPAITARACVTRSGRRLIVCSVTVADASSVGPCAVGLVTHMG